MAMVVVIAVLAAAMAAMPAKVDIAAWTLLEEIHEFETTDKVNIRNVSEIAPSFCSCAKRRTSGGVKRSGEGSRTPPQIRGSGGGLTKLVQFLLCRKWRSDGMRVSGCTQYIIQGGESPNSATLCSEKFMFIWVVYKHDLPSGGVNGSASLYKYFKLCYARYTFSHELQYCLQLQHISS